ncbi:MAG: nucleotidyltransferase domain-containing protein [Acinetobacter sp.]|nr:nucleotidyltransferase domain-containing protein [Acinetobacter sp.]
MNIAQHLTDLFAQREDIPLFYIESGSRLWGMASPDSDYDVRGFHLVAKSQYFDYRPYRDVIETMQGDFDFVSYDLDKMLNLLDKSNPTVIEWIRAELVYFNQCPDWHNFVQGFLPKIEYQTLYYHYLSLAKKHIDVIQTADNFTYKKVFYAIRGLFSAELALQQQLPALWIQDLFAQIEAQPLRQWAEQYLIIKQQQQERQCLAATEQVEILALLTQKIQQLAALECNIRPSQHERYPYLRDYAWHLKHHFYG